MIFLAQIILVLHCRFSKITIRDNKNLIKKLKNNFTKIQHNMHLSPKEIKKVFLFSSNFCTCTFFGSKHRTLKIHF
jgi:hypothetical protein